MRAKILFLIISIVLITVFAVLNVDEFTRISTLNLGFTTMQLPLGLVMLLVLVAIMLIFLVTTLYMHSSNLIETRKYAKQLTAQRELADRAEASRFTELRHYMEAQAALATNRESSALTAFDSRLQRTEKLVLDRLEKSDNSSAAYWGQHGDSLMRNRPLNSL